MTIILKDSRIIKEPKHEQGGCITYPMKETLQDALHSKMERRERSSTKGGRSHKRTNRGYEKFLYFHKVMTGRFKGMVTQKIAIHRRKNIYDAVHRIEKKEVWRANEVLRIWSQKLDRFRMN